MRILTAVLGVILMVNAGYAAEEKSLTTEKDRLSYSIGMDIGSNLKRQSIDIDAEILSKGIKDTLEGEKQLLTEEEFRATMENFRNSMMAKQQEQMKEVSEKNKKEGETFLAENKKKEGVVATASGLQYKIMKDGDGDMPKATDTVTVNYKGTLIDGTEFDSSYKRGQPATFPVNGVIPGWTEALQLMKTGAKWQLVIPSDLAYGERGAGQMIGPHSTLIFDVELISIKEAPAK
jgi:FKBP-type peptidyl-prolyl cis-trans isomerase FklB